MKERAKILRIIGPPGIEECTREALNCFYPGVVLEGDPVISFQTYTAGEELMVDDVKVKAFKAIHSPDTNPHMLRLEVGEKVIAFSGDTEWTDDLIPLSADANLFICEASAFEGPVKHHLTVKELVDNQHRLQSRKMVLTHPGPETLRHLKEIPFLLANDGDILIEE